MSRENTRDLMDFPLYALRKASKLLAAYRDPQLDLTKYLGNVVTPEFNPESSMTFLVDSQFAVGVLDKESKLRDWIVCGTCYRENFEKEFIETANTCCFDLLRRRKERARAA